MSDGQTEILEWDHDAPYQLGRHIRHDPRSRMFAAPYPSPITKDKKHRVYGRRLNQFRVGACTGFTAAAALNSKPHRPRIWPKRPLTNEHALDFYRGATRRDPWPGEWEPTDTGSSGLAVAQTLQALGHITSYEHAFGFHHGLGVIEHKPLLQGTYWTEDMFYPDASGQVHPTGDDAGGHEYLWIGVEFRSKLTEADNRSWFVNSWGREWGKSGYFWMTWTDHDALLQRDGDLISLVN